MRIIISVLVFLLSANLYAQFNYLPDSIEGHPVLHYSEFSLSYNEMHEQADWVAYQLTKTELEVARDRCDCFASDDSIATGSASPNDYSSSGFDRGHLAPSSTTKISEQANRESFLMTNMSPQLPGFNRGGFIWERLEEWEKQMAEEHDTLYVVTGPVFVNNLGHIGSNEVTIPGYFYKVILRFDEEGKAKTIAFLIPHVGSSNAELEDYIIPINALEQITGVDFFPSLPSSSENRVESQFAPTQWGF